MMCIFPSSFKSLSSWVTHVSWHSKWFRYVILFHSHNRFGRYMYYSYCIGDKLRLKKLIEWPKVTRLISGSAGFQTQICMMSKSMFINTVSPKDLSNKGVKNSGSGLPAMFMCETLLFLFILPGAYPALSQYTQPFFSGQGRWRGGSTCESFQHSRDISASSCFPCWSGSQPSVLPKTFGRLTSGSVRFVKNK